LKAFPKLFWFWAGIFWQGRC